MGYSNQFPFIPFIISDEVIVLGIEYSLGLFPLSNFGLKVSHRKLVD